MKRHTLIHSGVAVDNPHQYNVVLGTDMGQFSGTVVCRPEDYNHESRYFGFELAELKAEIEYARAKRKYYDAQMGALVQFWGEMSKTRTFDTDVFWVKKIAQRVDDLDNKRMFWADRVRDLQENYHKNIVAFDEYCRKAEARERKEI